VGVEEDVLMVSVLMKVGFPEGELNDAEAPEGSPEADKVTD